jgi:hypothetical protein
MKAAEELTPAVGTSVACTAIGVPKATVYRHRSPKAADALKPRPAPPRALSGEERQQVLANAHARHPEPFVHGLPRPLTPAAEVWINPPENKPQVRTLKLPRDSKFIPQVSQSP